eukprot:CAMPEP_0204166726 /NCGR_PEP_ID=MMETSP0361-20130328/39250_1 /ASSEMBLY_ACC=CAM_ASM_000343 /TAXON_ID=268821 /ORGANISM="Scrippsiella Hangoei, Strain SHTV-5" /LENGTH=140 /DNA_ID=CAMNT_0051123921 /DNA_START=22 /DNA_END=441 /DNA_ORIENTATION=+
MSACDNESPRPSKTSLVFEEISSGNCSNFDPAAMTSEALLADVIRIRMEDGVVAILACPHTAFGSALPAEVAEVARLAALQDSVDQGLEVGHAQCRRHSHAEATDQTLSVTHAAQSRTADARWRCACGRGSNCQGLEAIL